MSGIRRDPGGWGRELVETRRSYRVAQLQTLGFTCVVIIIDLALVSAQDGAVGSCSSATSTLLVSGLGFVVLGTLLWPLMILRALRAVVLRSSPTQSKQPGQRRLP